MTQPTAAEEAAHKRMVRARADAERNRRARIAESKARLRGEDVVPPVESRAIPVAAPAVLLAPRAGWSIVTIDGIQYHYLPDPPAVMADRRDSRERENAAWLADDARARTYPWQWQVPPWRSCEGTP